MAKRQPGWNHLLAYALFSILLWPGAASGADFGSLGPWTSLDRTPSVPGSPSARLPALGITATDPPGDMFGSGTVQHDVLSFTLRNDGSTLTLELVFEGTISPPEGLAPDSLVGFIDLDVDRNPMTGFSPAVDDFCPVTPAGLGDEYVVELLTYSATTADVGILDASLTEIGRAPMTFGTSSIAIEIPLALLGGDDGFVHTSAVVGTLLEPTDCVPDGTFLSNAVVPAIPTLGGLSLLLLGLSLVALGWRLLA